MEVKQLRSDNTLGTAEIDVSPLGDKVKRRLLFDAVHMYEARKRVGTACTKTRSEVAGSGKKPWRQKGTGRARAGARQSPIWRGGGIVHGPRPRDHGYSLPRRALKEALRSAVLSKFRDDEVRLVEDLSFESPSTKRMAAVLQDAEASGACLVVTAARDRNVHLSCRNLPHVGCLPVSDLNAYDVLRYRHMVLSNDACAKLLERF
jgi:large subunit ribosomal protein L4